MSAAAGPTTPPQAAEPAEPFASLEALRRAHRDLLQRYREAPGSGAVVPGATELLSRATATGALLDAPPDREAAQSLVDYWVAVLYRLGEEPSDAALVAFDPALSPPLPDHPRPYLGLAAFSEAEADRFFGRQALLDQVLAVLRTRRLLAVVGSSGSGKSSFVRAGLVPALRAGALPGAATWRTCPPLVPGSDPLAALAAAAAALVRPPDADAAAWLARQRAAFLARPDHLVALLREAGAPAADGAPGAGAAAPVLLVVDQLEEVFTLCADAEAQRAFAANLLALTTAPGARHTVVLTMRLDFLKGLPLLGDLQGPFEQGMVLIMPLSRSELRQAIERPAASAGLRFEAGIVDALVDEVIGEDAALPLLQFTLLQLWRQRQGNRVPLRAYQELGGAGRALGTVADRVYQGLIPEDQTAAKRILLSLVRPTEGREVTSRRIRKEELYRTGEAPERVDRVLGELVGSGLLRLTAGARPSDDQVEVAHEALIRNWGQLDQWLEEHRTVLREIQRLQYRAGQWLARGRRGGLLDQVELPLALAWLKVADERDLTYDATLRDFVRASEAAARRRQRTAYGVIVAGVVALVVIIIGLIYLLQRETTLRKDAVVLAGQADTARKEETEQRGRAVAAEKVATHLGQIALAQALGARAARQEAQALREDEQRALLARQAYLFSQATGDLAADLVDGGLRVALGTPYFSHVLETPSNVFAVAFNSDGKRLAAGGRDGTVSLWDLDQPTRTPDRLAAVPPEVQALAWNPQPLAGEQRLATAGTDGIVRLIDPAHPQAGPTESDLRAGELKALAWSPDGRLLAAGGQGESVLLLELEGETLQERGRFGPHPAAVAALAFGPAREDGRRFLASATEGEGGRVRLWDVGDPQAPPVVFDDLQKPPLNALTWSRDGRWLASGSSDNTILLWDVTSPTAPRPAGPALAGHESGVNSLAFSPDGRLLASASSDTTVRLWDVLARRPEGLPLRGHKYPVRAVAFSADGRYLASGSEDQSARVWDLAPPPGAPVKLGFSNELGDARELAVSPDGQVLAAGHAAGTVSLWDWQSVAPFATPLRTGERELWALAFRPALATGGGGRLLASGGAGGVVRLWDVSDPRQPAGTPLRELPHGPLVRTLAWSPDGRLLASGGDDGVVRLWDPDQADPLPQELPRDHDQKVVKALAFAPVRPDGRLLASGGDSGIIRIWDLGPPGGQPSLLHTLSGHAAEIRALAFEPGGRYLVSGSWDNTVRRWDLQRLDVQPPVKILGQHGAGVNAVAVGRRAIGGPGTGNTATVLATVSDDGTVRLWDLERLEVPPSILHGHQGPLHAAAFAPSGDRVISGGRDRELWIWPTSTEDLAEQVCRTVWRNLRDAEWKELVGPSAPAYQQTCELLPPPPPP